MAISEMRRVYVMGHIDDRESVLRKLQIAGVMEVGDITQSASEEKELFELIRPYGPLPEKSEYDTMVSNFQYGIDALAPYAPKKNIIVGLVGSLVEGIFGARRYITGREWDEVGQNLPKYLELCDHCREQEGRLGRLKGERTKLTETKEHLSVIEELRHPLERIGTSSMLVTILGTVESKRLKSFSSEMSRMPGHHLEPVSSARGQQYLLLVYLREDRGAMEETLKRYDFRHMPVSGYKGTPAEIIQSVEDRFGEMEQERKNIIKELRGLAEQRDMLLVAHDYASVRKMAADAAQGLGRTDKTFTIEGWARKADIGPLRKQVEEAAVIGRAPLATEKPPVMLENPPQFRPFQVVTNIYGKPKYAEIDPSALMAPFFLLFFALCLADAAYGIVLLAGSGVAYYKVPSGRRFFKLMMGCSAITIIVGFLMGGFLGNNLVEFRAVWIDPLGDPASFLVFALALGVLHAVYIGPGIRMYMNIKKRLYVDVILDQVTWMVFLTSLILFVLVMQGMLGTMVGRIFMLDSSAMARVNEFGASIEQYMIAVAAISALVIVLTRNRGQKFGGKRLVSGLASLYGVTGYMSDVLSYSRILALGMGTAVIAVVVNELAFMALDIRGVGILLAIVVLIVGHTFNIIMGTLSAFVHTARLQFIEFFGKFMEGGGRTFKPFCDRKKYVEIK